ncbi:MAG: hypothetical protein IPI60_05190 [Saprospiraceae bacterium]|nr:hypothetical protein [Saprospiraceae bacterium]
MLIAQNKEKTGPEWVKAAAEKLQKAQAECKEKVYEKANASYKDALNDLEKAKKAYGKEKASIKKVNEQIEKVEKEQALCKKWGDIHKKATSARKKCEDRDYEGGRTDFDAALKLLNSYKKALEGDIEKLERKKEKDPFLEAELERVKKETETLTKEKEKCIPPPAAVLPPDQGSSTREESRVVDLNPELPTAQIADSQDILPWDKMDLVSFKMKLYSPKPFPGGFRLRSLE